MTDDGPPRAAFDYLIEYMEKRGIGKYRFAEEIRFSVDHVEHVLSGSRMISHECAWAIGKAYPALKPLGLLIAQAKWRLHQLEHEGYQVPGRPGPKRKTDIDEALVRELYQNDAISTNAIRERTGVSLATMYRIIDDAMIPRRGRRKAQPEDAP